MVIGEVFSLNHTKHSQRCSQENRMYSDLLCGLERSSHLQKVSPSTSKELHWAVPSDICSMYVLWSPNLPVTELHSPLTIGSASFQYELLVLSSPSHPAIHSMCVSWPRTIHGVCTDHPLVINHRRYARSSNTIHSICVQWLSHRGQQYVRNDNSSNSLDLCSLASLIIANSTCVVQTRPIRSVFLTAFISLSHIASMCFCFIENDSLNLCSLTPSPSHRLQ
jgi:hypothetical protein